MPTKQTRCRDGTAFNTGSDVSHWFRRREFLDLDLGRPLLGLPEIIGHLVAQPRLGGSPARLSQPDRLFSGDAVVAVQQFRQVPAGAPEPLRRRRYGEV